MRARENALQGSPPQTEAMGSLGSHVSSTDPEIRFIKFLSKLLCPSGARFEIMLRHKAIEALQDERKMLAE